MNPEDPENETDPDRELAELDEGIAQATEYIKWARKRYLELVKARQRKKLRLLQGGGVAAILVGVTGKAGKWPAVHPAKLSAGLAAAGFVLGSLLWLPFFAGDSEPGNPPVAIPSASAPPSTPPPSSTLPPSTTTTEPNEPQTQQSLPPDVGNDVEPSPEPQQTGPIALAPSGGGQAPQAESEPPAEPPNERTESEPEEPPEQDTPDEPQEPEPPQPQPPEEPTEPHCDGLVRVDASPLAEVCLLG